jgi:hypothetical protein
MENQLQVSNNSLSTLLNTKEIEIAKIVWHVNQLVAYPLNDNQIEAWSKSINELLPDLELEELSVLINNFKIGRYDWNYHYGIQNILKNLIKTPEYVTINHDDRA